jgi:molybdopterin converting factor small subunit
MHLKVLFFSYFKDLTGCSETTVDIPDGSTLSSAFKQLAAKFPKLAAMEKCALLAVGVEYQPRDYILKPGDDISIFPPVQGG